MNEVMFEYLEIDLFIYKLIGVIKFICLILWLLILMLIYNIYIFVFMVMFGGFVFKLFKVKFK